MIATESAPSKTPVRWHGWSHRTQIRCSRGHHIREESAFAPWGFTFCKHKPTRDTPPCDEWLLIIDWFPQNAAFVATVTMQEARDVQRRELNLVQTLDLLGLRTFK